MAGQLQIPGYLTFDVTALEVLSEAGIDFYTPVPNIVDTGEDFTLQITLKALVPAGLPMNLTPPYAHG